jgi:hypothetical protein
MTAEIKLKKLSGVNIESGASNGTKTQMTTNNQGNFSTTINSLSHTNNKIVFAGQDYKGTFTATNGNGKGDLELYLERPENHFTIKDVKINKSGSHTFTCTGKNCEAKIDLTTGPLSITEQDSGWFTTGLTLNNFTPAGDSSLKFGEWNDFDLPDKCYVEINFV